MLKDYHTHSRYSYDSQQPLETLAAAAEAAQVGEICVTDHIDLGHCSQEGNTLPDLAGRHEAIQALRQAHPSLVIREGIEIGDCPATRRQMLDYLTPFHLDYHLLSLHMVDGNDPYYPSFYVGKERDAAYRRYAETLAETVAAWAPEDYDALAHLGYVAKFAPYENKPFRHGDAPDAIDAVLRCLARNGKALEINTSSLKNSPETMASRDILLRFRELGGEYVTLGSDAHAPEFVGYRLAEARQLALDCGFRYGVAFAGRRMTAYLL